MSAHRDQSGKPRYLDIEAMQAAMRHGGRPTEDDVIVLNDGTRLDTAEKARAWIEQTTRRNRASIETATAERAD